MEANWVIESTRWCPMQFPHCLRGTRQKKSMSSYDFMQIADKVSGSLSTITGGEPLLNIPVLKRAMGLDYVYITSSFAIPPSKVDEILDVITNFKGRYTEFSLSQSTDQYHEENRNVRNFKFMLDEWGILFSTRGEIENSINMGKAHDNRLGWRVAEEHLPLPDQENGDRPVLFVTVDGDVFPGCDWSYKALRTVAKPLWLGNLLKEDTDKIKERYVQLIGDEPKTLEYDECCYTLS